MFESPRAYHSFQQINQTRPIDLGTISVPTPCPKPTFTHKEIFYAAFMSRSECLIG